MKILCKRKGIIQLTAVWIAALTLAFPSGVKAAAPKPVLSGSSAVTKGKSTQLSVKYAKKKVGAKSCKWYSTKKSVAAVSKTGKVTGKKNGTAYIYVEYKGKTSAKKKIVVSTAALSRKKISLKGGRNYKLKTKYAGKYVKPVYKSSNKKIATVDKNGKVITLKKGKAVVTAAYKGSVAKCTVTVTSNHTHRWKKHTATKKVWVPKMVTVDDYEQQQVQVGSKCICSCGAESSYEHQYAHALAGEVTSESDMPIYETRNVKVGSHQEDHGSYKTKVSTYYSCSCGTRK